MSFLLDTNIISEVRKRAPNPQVLAWFSQCRGPELYISVLVLGEIRQGISRLQGRDPARAGAYEDWLTALLADYAHRVLPVTADVAQEWGRLNARDPVPVIDGLMAATAIVHSLTLVTRNIADVSHTGVAMLNPFEPSTPR